MTQDDAKYVALAPLAIRRFDPRPAAEIDLSLFTRGTLQTPHGQRLHVAQTAYKSLHAVIRAGETMLAREVLVDPLRAELLLELLKDNRAKRLAVTRPAAR